MRLRTGTRINQEAAMYLITNDPQAFILFTIIYMHLKATSNNVDSLEEVKDIVIYNIPTEHKDRFWNELMSYKEQIEVDGTTDLKEIKIELFYLKSEKVLLTNNFVYKEN
jgi:hypothetical protein